MTLIEELKGWKEDLETLGVERSKAEGRLEQAMETLKELGFNSIEEAQIELDRLIIEKNDAEEAATLMIAIFKEKYAEYIE